MPTPKTGKSSNKPKAPKAVELKMPEGNVPPAVSEGGFDATERFMLNWILRLQVEIWALREVLQKTGTVSHDDVKAQTSELEKLPIFSELQSSFNLSDKEIFFRVLKNLKGTVH